MSTRRKVHMFNLQRERPSTLVNPGKATARTLNCIQSLVKVDADWTGSASPKRSGERHHYRQRRYLVSG